MIVFQSRGIHFFYFSLIFAQTLCTIKAQSHQLAKALEDEIKLAGYPAESHSVTTEDGYILTVFRIPGSAPGSTPVYLQHGFQESGADWIVSGKDRSLAYILHDEGYDVWLGNARGNMYSKNHVNMTRDDPKFWDFSFTEIGIYDLPSVVNYITNLSGKQYIFYVGHSMGATLMSIMGIERPEVARKIKAMIALAPGTNIGNPKSLPLLSLSFFDKELYALSIARGVYEWSPNAIRSNDYAKNVCGSNLYRNICSLKSFVTDSYSRAHVDHVDKEKFMSHFPAGTSTKVAIHILQQIHRETKFNKFDYGRRTNLNIYNSTLPPAYDLSKMRIPTAVIFAERDKIVDSQGVKNFYNQLPVKLGLYKVPDKSFNHLDFIIAKDATQLVYQSILKIMHDSDTKNVNEIENK